MLMERPEVAHKGWPSYGKGGLVLGGGVEALGDHLLVLPMCNSPGSGFLCADRFSYPSTIDLYN